jgi:DNA-binding transcriptional ArsR family regulator
MPQRSATASTPPPSLDLVFKALADPTRRAVVERLGAGPLATSELARPFAMKLPSFTEHLGVLERSGLVTSQKHGRVRTYRLAPEPLADASRWLAEQREVWERRLDQLDAYLTTMPDEPRSTDQPDTEETDR